MEDKSKNSGSLYSDDANNVVSSPVYDGSDQSYNVQALSADPVVSPSDQASVPNLVRRPKRWLSWAAYAGIVLLFLSVGGLLIANSRGQDKTNLAVTNASSRFDTVTLPLEGLGTTPDISSTKAVTINGQLTVDGGLIIVPSLQPSTAQPGQLYYDTNSNTLAFFNGAEFVHVGGNVVEQIAGLTGQVGVGDGLTAQGGQLSNSGVLSVQGQVGSVTFTGGSGISLSGTTITNTGVVSIVSGSPSLTVSNDGSGNITLTLVGGGSGTVASPGGTAGRIAKFTGAQTIEDSLLSESGATVTVNGNLTVTGGLSLSAPLSVANGGTGAVSLGANGVLVGGGTSAITSVVAGAAGLCLVSTAGTPAWMSCTSSSNAVTSLNGLTGGLTIANATGSVNTITIDDATTSTKGIASFNGTNFTVTSGAVNTAQNISTGSSPTFAGVNTNNITPSGALTVGSAAQALSLFGSDASIFAVTGSGQTTTIGFSGIPTGAVNYNFDRSAAAGTYVICTTAANCAGAGGGVTTSGGTTNRLSKFTGTQTVGDSSVSDDGSNVTVLGSANLVVQGGTATIGTLSQAGSLVLNDGSSNTATIVLSGQAANRIYTIPDVGADADFCFSTGNCSTAGAPSDAAYLVASLNGTLSDERTLAGGSNISLTDGGANGNFTVATVQNPTFTTSVTTPLIQSSGVMTVASAAGDMVVINAGTTIELQDNTNVAGNLDVSGGLNVGTANAFVVSAAGAISSATGITSSGSITFSSLDCTTFANGGALTTDGTGQLLCSDDDGGAGSAISGSGTAGTVALFSGVQTIANSIITQSGTTITIAGDLILNTDLTVANGGTGASSFTANGLLYGNGAGALQATAAGTGGQIVIANATGVPTFVTVSGDIAVSDTGVATVAANSVGLGTDTTGDYVANLGTLTGLSTTGNSGEGSTPTLSVLYGSVASTAVQGNVTLTCPSGTGNLTGGGTSITLGTGGTCGGLNTVNNPTFTTSVTTPSVVLTGAGSSGTIQVGNLGQGTIYTLPDPAGAAADICISTGNCAASGTAGGDLTGSYPNPTIAKLQGTNLSISSPVAGHILVYNATNSRWENQAVTGDIAISQSGATTVQANSVALGTDTTGNYVIGLTAGTGASVSGSAGEGWTPTVSVLYGSTAGTAVEGNTSITVSAGTNLTGGGSITLGAGGTVTLNVASSPTFSGTLTVQGATATIGTAAQQGSVVLNDGSSNTGTIQTAALGQNTVFTLPDPGSGSASICLSTGNCAGAGGGVTTAGGTTNRISKFTGSQTIGDSSVSDDGTTVTINGTANLVVQGGTSTLGTTTQSGTLLISDGSSNTVSIVTGALSANRIYTLPDAGGDATLCVDNGNCIGGTGSAPNVAEYLVASLNGTLTNERALAAGSNISFTDAGANGNFTIATVQNPTFTTSVTTPLLQSSGALTISSTAGNTLAIDAGTTIELQDSTNVTGSLDVSVALNVGTLNAFQVSSGGAIVAATGITSSGTVIFSALDCTTFANGGAVTTNASGQLSCSDDDGAAAGTITGTGTSGTVALFSGAQTIGNSIVTQSGTTITIAGDLTLNTALSVANGGTGATSFTARGLLYGDGANPVQVTAAGTGGQVLIANATGVPTFATFSGDVTVSNTGVTTIQANSVALGTDTTGDYVANLGTLTGLSTTGNSGEGSTPTLSVLYGSVASTAVQGNVTLTCPSGTGNLTGGGTSVTLGAGGTCGNISTVNNPTFSTSVTTPALILTGAGSNGTIQVGNLGQGTVYTLPDPGAAAADICISTGNCSAVGTAGGDLTGSYPNPTIAKLQGTNLTISGPVGGHILVYNATSSQWENRAVGGDVALSEAGTATIQANSVALTTDTTGNYVLGLTAGTGTSVTGSAGEGWTPTISVLYGSSAGNAVEGNTSITVSAGTNLTGGGSITLGAGGSVTLNVANSPTFSGTLAVQGATATIGTAAQQGSVVLNDGSSNTGTIQTAALGQNTVFTLPDPAAGSATICLSTGNCAGSGSGVTTAGGTTNRISKFTASQAIGDSSISDDGTTVTINGTANLVVQGGTSTLGTTTQAGTLVISDGSSNTVSIVAAGLAADRTYTVPEAGANATFCMSSGNCVGGGGSAPGDAEYLLLSLHGSLTNERALVSGSNISFTDGGANGNLTVATVQNPTFTTSVTTPALQSSGVLTISSAAGNTIAIDAGTTIELQDSTNVTGSLDVSVALNVGTTNAFQVNASGAIAAATGILSSGTITFSALDCTTFANGGALTTNASGQLSCSDDQGASANTITGTGTSGTLPVFSGAQTVVDSIVTQSGTTITIAGDLNLNTALTVANGGTGAATFTSNGVLFGNGAGALQVTAAGTGGQVLIANATGVPTFATFSGDVTVSNTGVTAIQANSVALGTDTTGDYVANLGALTGLSTAGNSGEGSTPTLSVIYGSTANTAVQGNTTLTCPSGSGNLTGGGNSITLGGGGTCNNLSTVNNPTFSTSVTSPALILTGAGSNGTLQVASLGQATVYTLPDPAAGTATICISTGNCGAAGSAGGDLTGTYPNPTIASLQGGTLTISAVASGNILQYNGSAWVNQSISGDVTLNSSAVATIANGAVTSAKIFDGTIANGDLAAGSFTNITGVGTLGGLTVTGATAINTSGTANTAIGNGTGTLQLTSAGLNVSTAGALTGVAGITTSGGYTQSGATANTLTGATSFTAAGTALSVTNDASVGGTLTVNTITPNSALTVGAASQTFTVQGNASSSVKATDTGNTTTLGFATPTANTTLNLPALAAGTYTLCTSSGNCGGVGATLQTAYANSTNPEITLAASPGGLTVRDSSGGIGGNLLEVQNNDGSTTYFNVTATGVNITGALASSGNINTTGGVLQTNSTTRIENSGNLINIGNLTATGAITISSTGATNDIILNSADTIELQDNTNLTGNFVVSGTYNTNTFDGDSLTFGTAGTAVIQPAASQALTITAHGTSAWTTDSGNLTVDATAAGASLMLGTGGQNKTIQIGNTSAAVTQTIGIGNNATGGSVSNVTIGNLLGVSTTTIQAGTGNINLMTNSASAGTVVKNGTNSTSAFQIQNSLGLSGLNIDTTTTNVITNPSFETNTTGWVAKGSATLSRITTQYYDNDASLQAATTAASGDGAQYAYGLASSTQYSLSVYIKTSSGGANTFEIGYSNDGSTDTSCSTNIFGETGKWGHYTCTFTTGTTSGSPYIYVKQINAAARNIYIDAVSLETGGTASQYRNVKASLSGALTINAGNTIANSTSSTLYVQSNGGGDGVVIVGNGDGDILKNALKVAAADGTSIFNVNETSLGATVQGGSSGLGTPALQVISTSAGARALDIKAASGQTADIFRIKDNGDVTLLSVGSTGDVTVQPNANSASAFRILNANASVTLLSANTSSSTVSIGGALTATGNITNGGFDFTLGNTDQSTRGDTGLSRALVKNTGGVLYLNYAGDFTGGVQVGSNLSIGTTPNTSRLYVYEATTGGTILGNFRDNPNASAVEILSTGSNASLVRSGSGDSLNFNAGGGTAAHLSISTTGNITVGTSDTTGALFVLDTKTGTGDPTGVAGGMYYNSADGKFRCYENGAWLNCLNGLNSAVTVNDREDASYTANITSFGTTIVSGTYNDAAVVFVAPPSGKVMISYEAEMFNSGTGYTVIAPEVRTGGTIGSGTVVHTVSDNDNLNQSGATSGSHSRFIYLSGLTADSQYNVRLLHRVQSGTGTFLRRQVLVQPVW